MGGARSHTAATPDSPADHRGQRRIECSSRGGESSGDPGISDSLWSLNSSDMAPNNNVI